MKLFHKIFMGLSLSILIPASVFGASFSDISESHPQYSAIESLKNLEIINGYKDGSFKAQNPVNRVEALKMLLLSAKITAPTTVSKISFPDVETGAWFAGYVEKAKDLEIVKGDGATGKFVPTRQVSKAEFLKMLLESFKIDTSKHKNPGFIASDVTSADWFAQYMSYSKAVNLIALDASGNLSPSKKLSRGECAEIIYRLLLIQKGGETQKFLSLAESKLIETLLNISHNNIAQARSAVDSAATYSSAALASKPDAGIVKSANEVSLAMKDLVSAYEAGLEGKKSEVKKFAESAKKRAGDAYAFDASTQPIGKKIKQYADTLLKQVN